jgi:hypothetical protein
MGRTKTDLNGNVTEGYPSETLFKQSGSIAQSDFAVVADNDATKKLVFNVASVSPSKTYTVQVPAISANQTLTLPSAGGTLVTTATETNSFSIVQPISGTSPTASSPTDTLTLTSGDSTITISGNSSTKTLDFRAAASTLSFKTISTPAGTSPVAASATDTLTFASADSSVTITGNSTTKTVDLSVSTAPKICYISDVKSNGTDGGTATTGSWGTRVLNTINDVNTGITISSNQMILPAGTYHFRSKSPFHGTVNRAITRLQNITDTSTVLLGSSIGMTGSGVTSYSFIEGSFTLAAQKTLELQYFVQTTVNTTGLGFQATTYASGPAVSETYSQVVIQKA